MSGVNLADRCTQLFRVIVIYRWARPSKNLSAKRNAIIRQREKGNGSRGGSDGNFMRNYFTRDFARSKVAKSWRRRVCQRRHWRFSLRCSHPIRVSDRKVLKCAYSLQAIEPKQPEKLRKPLWNKRLTRRCEHVCNFLHFLLFVANIVEREYEEKYSRASTHLSISFVPSATSERKFCIWFLSYFWKLTPLLTPFFRRENED